VSCPKNHELRSGLELRAPSIVEPFEIGFGNGKALQSHNAIAEQADARDGVATKLSNEMGNKHCSLVPRLQPNSSPEYCPRAA